MNKLNNTAALNILDALSDLVDETPFMVSCMEGFTNPSACHADKGAYDHLLLVAGDMDEQGFDFVALIEAELGSLPFEKRMRTKIAEARTTLKGE